MLQSNAYKKYKKICNRIGMAMLLFFALFLLKEYLCIFVRSLFETMVSTRAGEVAYSLSSGITYFLSFTLPVLFYKKISQKLTPNVDMHLDIKVPKLALLIIPAAMAANMILAYVNSIVLLPFNYNVIYDMMTESYPDGYYLYHFVLDVFSTAVVPAVCEEILFRGLVVGVLLPYGKKTAVIGSAFLFAMMHQNLGQFIYTFGMGIILAILVIETKSIFTGIIFHFCNNLFSVVNTMFTYIYPESRATFISNVMLAVLMVLGLACLIVLLFMFVRKTKDREDLFVDEDENVCTLDLVSEDAPISKSEKRKGFFAPMNIAFISLAAVQMLLLLFIAILNIPLA